jgi:kynurenine formamidase
VKSGRIFAGLFGIGIALVACSDRSAQNAVPPSFEPTAVVDLGALVTEDLAERRVGKKFLTDYGFTRRNEFEVIRWESELPGGTISGQNSYYTFFNHAGPHIDAPNHVGPLGGGIDSYSIESFSGALKVFDVSEFATGFSVPKDFFASQDIRPNEIVVIYTGYEPPQDDESLPQVLTLTRESSEYLANIPIRAFGTDSASVFNFHETPQVEADSVIAQTAPIHHSFLSRQIPVYEGLFNVDQLLDGKRMYFVGVPISVKDGDGMLVRPVVFVY